MTKSDVISLLKEGSVRLQFMKANGDLRDMTATLSESRVQFPDVAATTRAQKVADTTQAVWDESVNGWRSFRWDSIRNVNGTDYPSGVKS